MSAPFPFTQVDVFTERPLLGNPLAVVHGADALDDGQMQAFAQWTNLSETTFLLAPTDPGADYRVRIFTPGGELPFAGHPTLGSCHAWLEQGGVPKRAGRVVQQCGVGLVELRAEAGRTAFAAPPLRMAEVEASLLGAVLRALGLEAGEVVAAQWLDNGPHWLGLALRDAAAVLALEPDHAALRTLAKVGVVGAHAAGSECAFEVRAFVSMSGVAEDPVTGSLNAGLAEWLIGSGRAPERYVAAQGARLGRAGRVHVAREGGRFWIGGSSVSCIRGEVRL
ncbi:MAG: PhzF family phenazine biosynthesis protein [Burkholderiales bacterium]|nr:PhzF family phenazine biosynthesis protein [Burkholderiales bacterium]